MIVFHNLKYSSCMLLIDILDKEDVLVYVVDTNITRIWMKHWNQIIFHVTRKYKLIETQFSYTKYTMLSYAMLSIFDCHTQA